MMIALVYATQLATNVNIYTAPSAGLAVNRDHRGVAGDRVSQSRLTLDKHGLSLSAINIIERQDALINEDKLGADLVSATSNN